jgi:hypothetical protein
MSTPLKMAIPECTLPDTAVGPQIARYRQLARHVVELERRIGEVRVRFDATVPDGLLARTLAVEQGCCAFVGLDYEPATRSLAITVANVDQDPRPDTLAMLLTP